MKTRCRYRYQYYIIPIDDSGDAIAEKPPSPTLIDTLVHGIENEPDNRCHGEFESSGGIASAWMRCEQIAAECFEGRIRICVTKLTGRGAGDFERVYRIVSDKHRDDKMRAVRDRDTKIE